MRSKTTRVDDGTKVTVAPQNVGVWLEVSEDRLAMVCSTPAQARKIARDLMRAADEVERAARKVPRG